jgi:hypothetical protein
MSKNLWLDMLVGWVVMLIGLFPLWVGVNAIGCTDLTANILSLVWGFLSVSAVTNG